MKKNWPNIINPPCVYQKKNSEARTKCKWEPPPSGWFKLNFDGAARGNPGIAGIGCIVNDDGGKWIGKLASPIPPTTNNMAELEAVHKGIQICISLGVTKVIIEGDSQIILNALRKRETPNWSLNAKLKEVLLLFNSFEEYRFDHIF